MYVIHFLDTQTVIVNKHFNVYNASSYAFNLICILFKYYVLLFIIIINNNNYYYIPCQYTSFLDIQIIEY